MDNNTLQPISTPSITTDAPQPVQIPPKSSHFLRFLVIGLALILFGILVGVAAARFLPLTSTTLAPTSTPTTEIAPSATPTVDSTTDWQTYTDPSSGFSFKYPNDVLLNSVDKNSLKSILSVEITPINKITDAPLGFDRDTANKDISSLSQGLYGQHISFGIPASEKIFKFGDIYGKTYTETEVLEVCDVRFSRTAIIYHNNYQIIVNYNGPKSLISSLPTYFITDQSNCGDSPMWKEGNSFYQDVSTGKAPQAAQQWYDTFTQILTTFKFSTTQANNNLYHYSLKDGSSLDYPSGWNVTDKTTQDDIYQNGDLQWAQDITLEKDSYQLSSRNPLDWGPSVCLFPDSPDYNNVEGQGIQYPTYTEFTRNDIVYRRVKSDYQDGLVQRWGICTKQKNSAGFGRVSGFGSTTYTTPLQYDERVLSIMDSILMSIQTPKKTYGQ